MINSSYKLLKEERRVREDETENGYSDNDVSIVSERFDFHLFI